MTDLGELERYIEQAKPAIAKLRDGAFRFLDWMATAPIDEPIHDFINPGASNIAKLF